MVITSPRNVYALRVRIHDHEYTCSVIANRVTFPLYDLDLGPWMADTTTGGGVGGGNADTRKNSHRASLGDLGYPAGMNGGLGGPRRSVGGGGGGGGSGYDGNGYSHNHHGSAAPAPKPPVLYDLVGVVQHTGGLEHGHYTTYSRDDDTGEREGGGGGRGCTHSFFVVVV